MQEQVRRASAGVQGKRKSTFARQDARTGEQGKEQEQVRKPKCRSKCTRQELLHSCAPASSRETERARQLICLFERESALKKRIWERESWYFSLRERNSMCLFERDKINMSLWERHHSASQAPSLSLSLTRSLSLSLTLSLSLSLSLEKEQVCKEEIPYSWISVWYSHGVDLMFMSVFFLMYIHFNDEKKMQQREKEQVPNEEIHSSWFSLWYCRSVDLMFVCIFFLICTYFHVFESQRGTVAA